LICYFDFFHKDQRETQIDDDGIRRGDIVLNDIHWTLIEETFKNCLGQQFVDKTEPQISWVWVKDGKDAS
jgi:hypothetical protein